MAQEKLPNLNLDNQIKILARQMESNFKEEKIGLNFDDKKLANEDVDLMKPDICSMQPSQKTETKVELKQNIKVQEKPQNDFEIKAEDRPETKKIEIRPAVEVKRIEIQSNPQQPQSQPLPSWGLFSNTRTRDFVASSSTSSFDVRDNLKIINEDGKKKIIIMKDRKNPDVKLNKK